MTLERVTELLRILDDDSAPAADQIEAAGEMLDIALAPIPGEPTTLEAIAELRAQLDSLESRVIRTNPTARLGGASAGDTEGSTFVAVEAMGDELTSLVSRLEALADTAATLPEPERGVTADALATIAGRLTTGSTRLCTKLDTLFGARQQKPTD